MADPLDRLALFGGRPAFPERLHVGRPNIGSRERFLALANDILDRRWLTNHGRYVQEFEERVATLLGVKHCIAMCNGTVALEIVIHALGLSGEVIVPPFTFVATAHALRWLAITPVFCDIDPTSHTLDPRRVEALITPRTTAILAVHIWGRPSEIDALQEISHRHRLHLLFDAAHAFHCSYGGRMIGGFGEAEVFSFHATKILNTFEGGAVTTNDDRVAAQVRLMQNFGFADYDTVVSLGTNGKMTEIAAAMGLAGLESLPEFLRVNRRNYHHYHQLLSGLKGVSLVRYDEREACNYHYVVLEIDEDRAGIRRDTLHQVLQAENIMARRYFYPGCHRMEPYARESPLLTLTVPNAEALCRRVLCLPTGTAVELADVERICGIIQTAVAHARAIEARFEAVQHRAIALRY